MKRISILLATVALALWSCSQEHEDPHTAPTVYDPTQIITVITDLETRGTPIQEASKLMDFGLYCAYTGTSNWTSAASLAKMNNTKLLRTVAGGAWQYDVTPVYWDAATAADQYTFFAYAPYATASNGITINAATTGIPTLNYSVPTTANQPDLMVAVPQTDVIAGSAVTLPMKHALTCVGFKIFGNGEKVTGIYLSGVYLSGTLSMDPEITGASTYDVNWTNLGAYTTTDLSPLLSPILSTSPYTTTPSMTNLLADNGYLMMIPQTLGEDAKLTVTYEGGTSIEFDLEDEEWIAGDMKTYNITTKVVVTPEALVIPHTGTDGALNNITVKTSQPGIEWTLQAKDPWLTLSLNPNGPGTTSPITATGPQTVYTFAGEHTSTSANRTTTVTLNGTTTEVVQVTQLYSSGGLNVLTDFYIGAFWRADEKGERILRNTTNTQPWIVTILWMDDNWAPDDILLAPGLNSKYTDFAAVNSSADNGETNEVPIADTEPLLSGTGEIEFRVGLKTKWSENVKYNAATAPARYAVLVLSYGEDYGLQQKIFLRQGHEADYVMRNGDPATTLNYNWDGNRTKCMKFSPYNLTAPQYKPNHASYVGDGFTGSNATNHATIPARAGIPAANVSDYFTDYPTQAGAFFQWAANAAVSRKAYHPTKPSSGSITGWSPSAPTTYWNTLGADNETCPPGWRRANDGATDAAVEGIPLLSSTAVNNNINNSEVRQSLWLNPRGDTNTHNLNNAIKGYYADGYFDRLTVGTSISNVANSAVARETSIPAYRGTLFYNPVTNASLFIPLSGGRSHTNGTLYYSGLDGYSWASSAIDTSNGWALHINATSYAGQDNFYRATAKPIRCVLDPIDPSFTVDPFTPDPTPTELK